MGKVYVYYESKNINDRESTRVYIEIFETYQKAKIFMNERREELIKENLEPHQIDGLGDKSWVRLYKSKEEDYYVDLTIEEHEVR